MVFSSIVFLAFFLPALLAVYFMVPRRLRFLRNLVLLVFSLIFYGWGGPKFLTLLGASIVVNYTGGLFASDRFTKPVRTVGLTAAVALNLGLLGWFKYAGFFAEILNTLGAAVPVPQIVLPIGISFFTFQGLSYVIDVYRGDAQLQKNPLYVALYVALFPQLVAGPIVRYTTVEAAIIDRNESLAQFSSGVTRFLFGLGKKMLIANAMGEVADGIFAVGTTWLGTAAAWVGVLAYTAQIYFDFSAYSDMAIGLGRMFGFEFLENFNYPYIAKSITEFWRRWHISLSTWFRDYVYIPLGGSRCARWRHVRNIAVVWLLTGLWHGAQWTFVLWGAWFGLLLLGEKYLWGKALAKAPAAVGHLTTMLAVMFGWVLFRAPDPASAAGYFRAMLGLGSGGTGLAEAVFYLRQYWVEFIAAMIAALPVKVLAERWLSARAERSRTAAVVYAWGPGLAALALLSLSYVLLAAGSFNPFIYFQF